METVLYPLYPSISQPNSINKRRPKREVHVESKYRRGYSDSVEILEW